MANGLLHFLGFLYCPNEKKMKRKENRMELCTNIPLPIKFAITFFNLQELNKIHLPTKRIIQENTD